MNQTIAQGLGHETARRLIEAGAETRPNIHGTAAITPTTINPPHSGERLNLSLAIWIAFANARAQADRVIT